MLQPMENQLSPVFQCQGLNGGELFHCGDGFYYAKHVVKSDGITYLRCKTRCCKGAAKLLTTGEVRHIQHLTAHSDGCHADLLFEETLSLRRKILERCKAERTPMTAIFREEYNRVLPEVAATITLPQLTSSMKRSRSKGTPRIPDSYVMYENLLTGRFRDTDGAEYSFERVGEEEDESVCFLIDPLKEVLIKAEEIHVDGTFKIVPSVPRSRQLFTVLAVENDHAIPVAFALMKSKSANAYKNVLNYIKSKCDGLNPKLIMSDFETGIKAAVKDVFPDASHKGCWFHFTQAIFKRVQRSGQLAAYNDNVDFKRAVRMVMCLALLPAHLVEDGFNFIKSFTEEKRIMQEMEGILTYFKSQWIEKVGPSSFSVYGHPRRTNNVQESFHHQLNGLIGKSHPNVWEFTDALCAVASSAVRDHLRLESRGAPLTLGRRRRWVLQDTSINKAQENVVLGRISPNEFLRQMTFHITAHVPLSTVVDDADEDVASLPDPMRVHTVPIENQEVSEDHEEGAEAMPLVRGRGRRVRGGRGRGRSARGQGDAGVVRGRNRGGGRGRPRGRGRRVPVAAAVEMPLEADEDLADDPLLVPTEEEPEIVSPYDEYRVVVTTVDGDRFMTDLEVTRQRAELRLALGIAREPSVPSEDTHRCTMCLTNRPTRLCIPCGHIVMCRNCTDEFLNHEQFHTVILPNGDLMETHIRLPWCCPLCRAIIGTMPKVILPSV